jgi:1-acyl-sn-glycerol-3-phosphate acyltransferase
MSLVDTPLLFRWLPGNFRFLAKRELLNVPFIGWYLRRGGHLTVSRGSIRSSIESMNEAARLIRERRISVLIFPEGTRSREGMKEFKDGAAYLAIAAGVPAVPVALVGSDRVLPAKSSYFRPGRVEIRIGDPIPTGQLTLKDRGALTRQLEHCVRELFARAQNEEMSK